jgi:L-2-hydroxyglutarate oxidase LhgO
VFLGGAFGSTVLGTANVMCAATLARGRTTIESADSSGLQFSGASPFSRHIYPMPDGAWLGLHATVDLGNRCKFGPDIEWIPEIDYTFKPEKLDKFLDFIRMYYPDLDESRLHPDYTGIRPKLYREGEPVPDFRIDTADDHGLDGLVMLFGIESPGLTASLAIADHIAGLYEQAKAAA